MWAISFHFSDINSWDKFKANLSKPNLGKGLLHVPLK